MLVLSRRLSEKLILPDVPATIQVVAVRPQLVRLGIEAPPHVAILREEVRPRALAAPPQPAEVPPARVGHALRERLNNLVLGVALVRHQVRAGQAAPCLATLDRMDAELQALQLLVQALGAERPEPAAAAPAGPGRS